ncbi:MAG: biopolymer transporter ExbD [Acidobacteriota bacterium]
MRSTHRPSDEIPTSSMADIAFLLIIFFMITITFSATRGLDFRPPHDDEKAVTIDPVEAVLVEVERGGVLHVDRRPMGADEVAGYLAPRLAANPEKPVILRPGETATYGDFAQTFDLLRRIGIDLQIDGGLRLSVPTEREVQTLWPTS